MDLITRFIFLRIALGGHHHACRRLFGKLHFTLRQRTLAAGAHHGKQVAFHKRKHHLGFRVAEAAVILNHLGAFWRKHQPKVQAALKRTPLLIHRLYRRQKDGAHTLGGNFLGIIRVRCNRAHAAGIQALIAVQGALMIHRGNHRLYRFAVGKG